MACECIKCGKQMENVMEGRSFQPMGGLSFGTYGHYGSAVFDPLDGSVLEIVVCDECIAPLIGTPLVFQHPPKIQRA